MKAVAEVVLRPFLRLERLELRDGVVDCVVQGFEYRTLPKGVDGKHGVDGIRLEADIERVFLVVDAAETLDGQPLEKITGHHASSVGTTGTNESVQR